MPRPPLDLALAPDVFREWYWLKDELLVFCRIHDLPTAGPKQEVADRIATFLTDGTVLAPRKRTRPAGTMPTTFTRETVIGPGWRCSQTLRAFFEREAGPGFRFNETLRTFIREGEGRTLADALAVWEENRGARTDEIAPQFEYNRHMRTYFEAYPEATREDAIAAWHDKRGVPRQTPL